MGVTKIWDVKTRLDRTLEYVVNPLKTESTVKTDTPNEVLDKVINYTQDSGKTQMKKYVTAINCNTTYAKEQFENVKRHFDKNDGILAYHAYQSFADYDDVTADIAHEIGVKLAEEIWGNRFQIIISTHLNTDCLHNHFLVNSVSFVDGKKYHDCRASYQKIREVSDRLCREYGLTVIENPKRGKEPIYIAQADKTGMPTRYSMTREAVDKAISKSHNMKELEMNLKGMGYKVQFSSKRKYWTVTPKGWDRAIRLYRLGENYTNEKIVERVAENSKGIIFAPFHRPSLPKKQYLLITRKERIGKIKGIRGLYLKYCYMLGYLPKYTQNPKMVHYLLKDELMKCEQYTNQVRFLGKHKIETEDELKFFIEMKHFEKDNLTAEREELRRKIRRKLPEDEIANMKKKIVEISKSLKELRDDIKMAENIGVKSVDIKEKISNIENEKEVKAR